MWKEIFVLFGISVAIVSSLKVQCKHASECASDECCYYHEGPMVASKKRQAAILPFAGMVQGGWCEKYRTQGEHCSGIATMNGPLRVCTWFEMYCYSGSDTPSSDNCHNQDDLET
ncbi:Hypothetical predicted protein [Mytilus galloprovincialis]|uniref:Uncharacterized protein n=1 Tax=Mytilus galloprovincialis TaxID=29158 RepID=A0A8B6FWV4_MYTGA|nr:Hypothetical predicted protein [Mytilus galloprovincialis]